jgi:hypothetical protein
MAHLSIITSSIRFVVYPCHADQSTLDLQGEVQAETSPAVTLLLLGPLRQMSTGSREIQTLVPSWNFAWAIQRCIIILTSCVIPGFGTFWMTVTMPIYLFYFGIGRNKICLSKGCQNPALSGYCGDHELGWAILNEAKNRTMDANILSKASIRVDSWRARPSSTTTSRPWALPLVWYCPSNSSQFVLRDYVHRLCFEKWTIHLSNTLWAFEVQGQWVSISSHRHMLSLRPILLVCKQFIDSWRHTTQKPHIKHIYAIVNSKEIMERYAHYQTSVASKMGHARDAPNRGNEQRRFHGTWRSCNLGNYGVTKLCSQSDCSLCQIIRSSFDIELSGKRHWGRFVSEFTLIYPDFLLPMSDLWLSLVFSIKFRFGYGIYTTSTSSKADYYIRNTGSSSTRALLLNQVIVGRGEKLLYNAPDLTKPPSSQYDSVSYLPLCFVSIRADGWNSLGIGRSGRELELRWSLCLQRSSHTTLLPYNLLKFRFCGTKDWDMEF